MANKTKIVLASMFFLIVVLLHLLGLLFNENLAFFTKPFITISLVIVYLISVKKANFWFVSALFFSFWGDTFLLFKEEFFLLGLVSFLITHVLYIKISVNSLKNISFNKIIIATIPFIIAFMSVFFLIKENLGGMLVPVIIYGIIISAFGTVALLNYFQEKNIENLWLFLGAVVFIISDSLLAINKFYEVRAVFGFSIMITYMIAQYLICKAMIAKETSL
jgi:uncharacterized membrane protein YhhN